MLLAAGSFLSQMMLLCGMLMLAWILVRRNLRLRKRNRISNRELRGIEKSASRASSAAPLADAPQEVLRWQASMFDLQRELKAELDTKIVVVQSLLRQVDQRMAEFQSLNSRPGNSVLSQEMPLTAQQSTLVTELAEAGFAADEIAIRLGISQADVELSLSLLSGGTR